MIFHPLCYSIVRRSLLANTLHPAFDFGTGLVDRERLEIKNPKAPRPNNNSTWREGQAAKRLIFFWARGELTSTPKHWLYVAGTSPHLVCRHAVHSISSGCNWLVIKIFRRGREVSIASSLRKVTLPEPRNHQTVIVTSHLSILTPYLLVEKNPANPVWELQTTRCTSWSRLSFTRLLCLMIQQMRSACSDWRYPEIYRICIVLL